jgi:hypothetical protein
MPWLTDLEVGCYLVETKLLDSVPADPSWLNALCELVKTRWQRDTGWNPYLVADATDLALRTRSKVLDLPSVLRSHSALTFDGEALTENTDYMLIGRGETIRFLVNLPTVGASVEITDAVLGRETDLPEDVKAALLALCAAEFAVRSAGVQGVVHDVRQGDVSYRSRETLPESMRQTYMDAVHRYRRVVLR